MKYAAQYGFDSITPSAGPFLDKSAGDIEQWLGQMRKSGIRYGSAGLPVDFRRDEDRYQQGLGQLPKQARVLKQLGVTRMATWILPGDSEMTYLKNFHPFSPADAAYPATKGQELHILDFFIAGP